MIDHADRPVLSASWEAGWQVWLRAALWQRSVADVLVGDGVRRAVLMRQFPDVSALAGADWQGAFAGQDVPVPWPASWPAELARALDGLEAALLRVGVSAVPSAFGAWLEGRWGSWPPAALAPTPCDRDPAGFVPLPVGEVELVLAWPAAIAAAGETSHGFPGPGWQALLDLARRLRLARAGEAVALVLPPDLPGGPVVEGVAARLIDGLLASALPVKSLEAVRAGVPPSSAFEGLTGSSLYQVLDGLREEPVLPWDLQAGAWLAFLDLRAAWTLEAASGGGTERLGQLAGSFMDLVRKSLETAALHRLLRDAPAGGTP
ncbi:MAG: hypothetical protein VKP57_13095 [Candidatus Sericytochromatia bacterium]|nr:hypothetical protein [Candidatus Sericytochromatia bacterium]